jgi:hypothetical protein
VHTECYCVHASPARAWPFYNYCIDIVCMRLSSVAYRHDKSWRCLACCMQVILAADEASAARWGALDDVVMVSTGQLVFCVCNCYS